MIAPQNAVIGDVAVQNAEKTSFLSVSVCIYQECYHWLQSLYVLRKLSHGKLAEGPEPGSEPVAPVAGIGGSLAPRASKSTKGRISLVLSRRRCCSSCAFCLLPPMHDTDGTVPCVPSLVQVSTSQVDKPPVADQGHMAIPPSYAFSISGQEFKLNRKYVCTT